MENKRDYYEVLGVSKNADKEEIKKAYRKLAMKHHPDRNAGDKESEKKFKEASEAAEILLSDDKKSRYDKFGHAGVSGQSGFGAGGFEGFSDLGDIFGDIFGDNVFGDIFGGGGRRGGRRSRPGPEVTCRWSFPSIFWKLLLELKKKISLNRLMACSSCNGTGGEKGSSPATCDQCQGRGEVRRQQGFFVMSTTCPKCNGSGQTISNPCRSCRGDGRVRNKVELEVKVPAGIDEGQRLKLSGEGDQGVLGGPSGSLYVVIKVNDHEFFEREENDVYCAVPISFSQAALGAEIEVPVLNGKVSVKIPAGTQSGKKMRLKGKGIPRLGGYGSGDQILDIHVETPTKLGSEQKKLFSQLGEYETEGKFNPMSRTFFDKMKTLFQ